MKRIILAIYIIFILAWCWKVENIEDDILISTPVTVKVVKKDDNGKDIIINKGTLENKNSKLSNGGSFTNILTNTNSWVSISTSTWVNTDSWVLILSNTWTNTSSWINDWINLFNAKVKPIEEQYCVSKWGKVLDLKDKKICFITDEIWLLKCDINIFYLDKCREKSEKEKMEANTWKNLNDKEVKTTTSLNWSIVWKEDLKEVWKTKTLKIQVWKSWKYFIEELSDWKTILRVIKNDWKNVIIFEWDIDQKIIITDFELMYNKRIKVFYQKWDNKILKEKVIDLNSIL